MFSSLRLGKLFGIDVFVHATFWLLPVFVFLGGAMAGDVAGAALDVVVLFAVFGCVALHEVGHALAAAYYGIRTRHITLYPVGGVAALERMPERPLHEIVVALAGPLVNVLIAFGLVVAIAAGLVAAPNMNTLAFGELTTFDEFAWRLLAANVFLVLFNLIPAFPMDGGRVLRAALGTVMRRTDATRAAVAVGSVIAVGFVLVGLYLGHFSLILVGGVVFFLGRMELAQVRAVEAQREWERRRVDEYYDDEFEPPIAEVTAPPHSSFTGWKFDPARKTWSEWRNGVLIREFPAF